MGEFREKNESQVLNCNGQILTFAIQLWFKMLKSAIKSVIVIFDCKADSNLLCEGTALFRTCKMSG